MIDQMNLGLMEPLNLIIRLSIPEAVRVNSRRNQSIYGRNPNLTENRSMRLAPEAVLSYWIHP
jgi:hypothetical protein